MARKRIETLNPPKKLRRLQTYTYSQAKNSARPPFGDYRKSITSGLSTVSQ
jgi:hypothetical protein